MPFKLKGLRVAMGIQQKEFAKQLGITPQYLNRIERGVVEPRRDLMIKISKSLTFKLGPLPTIKHLLFSYFLCNDFNTSILSEWLNLYKSIIFFNLYL